MIHFAARMTLLGLALSSMIVSSACSPRATRDVPERIDTYIVDFTPYMSQGFLITPEAYHGDYESVGYIDIYYHAGSDVYTTEIPRNRTETIKTTVVANHPVDVNRALNALYEAAKGMGADAIMRFEMKGKVFVLDGRDHQGLMLSGFAIKREGAFD